MSDAPLYVQRSSSATWSVTDADGRVLHVAGRERKAFAWARRRSSNVIRFNEEVVEHVA